MNKHLFLLLLPIYALAVYSCDKEDELKIMQWEIVSITPDSGIEVYIEGDSSTGESNIFINANYKAGEVILKCRNYNILNYPDYPRTAGDVIHNSEKLKYREIYVDERTVKFEFEEDASGRPSEWDLAALNHYNWKYSFGIWVFIERSFGELQPTD